MMVKISHILGMNAREQLYAALNSQKAKRFGFSKLRAKEFLKKHGIQVPTLYAKLTTQEELHNFRWESISSGFAVKPSNGSAGKGVLVLRGRSKKTEKWIGVDGKQYTAEDLSFHAGDILEGQYSTWGTIANVIVEERVPIHPGLEEYAALGTPDVRVVVFNKIPVMAMLRLPTVKSGGRANLDQGALGLGIDMGTGKTTHGVSGKKLVIRVFPDSGKPVSGILIPFWDDVLKTSVRVANATGLRFLGTDIFLHPTKGPMVAEVNAYPGLSIQLANRAGMRKRLERLDEVVARNVNHAVKIGQALFAESYPATSIGDTEYQVLSTKEEVEIMGDQGKSKRGTALINTGRLWSAIALDTAQELGLADENDILWTQQLEGEGSAMAVEVRYRLRGILRKTTMLVSKKLDASKYALHLGRRDLGGFLVKAQEARSAT